MKLAFKLQGSRTVQGLDCAIENKKGSRRKWYDPHGKETGSTLMFCDYGYIRKTHGTDGEEVDCYIGPNPESKLVFIVNQRKKPEGEIKKDGQEWKEFDEHKCLLGYASLTAAREAYLRQYNDPRFLGSITTMSIEDFTQWVHDTKKTKKEASKKPNGKKVASLGELITKVASGDMFQYFADNPEKVKEKKERDRKKTAVDHFPIATFGGAAADSSIVLPGEKTASEIVKIAVSAGWIRDKAVSGLAKRNIALDGKQQAGIARKAVAYAQAKELGGGIAEARKDLRGVLGKAKDMLPNTSRRRPAGGAWNGAWRPAQGEWTAAEKENARAYGAYEQSMNNNYADSTMRDMAGLGAMYGGVTTAGIAARSGVTEEKKLKRFANHMDNGTANIARAPEPSTLGAVGRGIATPLGMGAFGGGVGAVLGNFGRRAGRNSAVGAGIGALGGAALGHFAASKQRESIGAQADRLEEHRSKAAAMSPAVLSSLQHGAVGAGVGAVAGGLGGMAHAAPGHRGEGFGRGALVGAGLGAAGGAGVSAIKSHGAQQLQSLQTAAHAAETEAVSAHNSLKNWGGSSPAPSQVDVHAATARAQLAPAPRGTAVARPGAVASSRPDSMIGEQGRAAMRPESWGHTNGGGVVPTAPLTAAPLNASVLKPVGRGTVTETVAASAGGRAEALRQAATNLGQQQQAMNKGINQGALAGAAAGTGLMGYMAVPRQYGGVGAAPQKQANLFSKKTMSPGEKAHSKYASDERTSRIADRLDDVGIATLASPYLADAAAGGMKRLMLRGGRVGAFAAEGHGIAEALAHKLHHPGVELAGLGLVAPGITHNLAKPIAKMTAPKPVMPVQPDLLKTAEEVGRALANPNLTKHSGKARLALGLGAIGAAGGAILGGKKAIDSATALATHHSEPGRYTGVQPGMRPASVAGY